MGNNVSTTSSVTALAAGVDSYLGELGDGIQYESSVSSSRLFKTVKARHPCGTSLVVKIFIKPEPGLRLAAVEDALRDEAQRLKGLVSQKQRVVAPVYLLDSERASFIVRPWLATNLWDRISTRPFLKDIEKRWIAWQLLRTLEECHACALYHGDIKAENVLMTTTNHAYLADFSAPVKPLCLPDDNPADFSFFFDTSARRSCYVAPERFASQVSDDNDTYRVESPQKRQASLSSEMDIFSLGCVFAELFLDGDAIFNLSQLLEYRNGRYSPTAQLNKILDPQIRSMISSMIALDPDTRPTTSTLLTSQHGQVFPVYFANLVGPLLELSQADIDDSRKRAEVAVRSERTALLSAADAAIGRIDAACSQLFGEQHMTNDVDLTSNGALLLLTEICGNIRNCYKRSSKLMAIALFQKIAVHLQDEDILDRMLPFLLALLEDEEPEVRASTIRVLCKVLEKIQTLSAANHNIFPLYICPALSKLVSDESSYVRATYAGLISRISQVALRFLHLHQAQKDQADTSTAFLNSGVELEGMSADLAAEESLESLLSELQAMIRDQVSLLLFDESTVVRKSLLLDLRPLCQFFGRQGTNDVILSRIITYLNSPDASFRIAFFRALPGVAEVVGKKSAGGYLFPLLIQALTDPEEFVLSEVLLTLAVLMRSGSASERFMGELAQVLGSFLYHPSHWVRFAAAEAMTSLLHCLSLSEWWLSAPPMLRPCWQIEQGESKPFVVLDHVHGALTRPLYELVLEQCRHGQQETIFELLTDRTDQKKSTPLAIKLRDMAITEEQCAHAIDLRYHIEQVAKSTSNRHKQPQATGRLTSTNILETTKLCINSENIFFTVRTRQARSPGSSDSQGHEPLLEEKSVKYDALADLKKIARTGSGFADGPLPTQQAQAPSIVSAVSESRPLSHMQRKFYPPPQPHQRTISTASSPSLLPAFQKHSQHHGPENVGKGVAATAATTENAQGLMDGQMLSPQGPKDLDPEAKAREQDLPESGYEGDDEIVRGVLEQVSVQHYARSIPNIGPSVAEQPINRKLDRSDHPQRSNKGVGRVLANLTEHKAAITSMCISPDHLFLCSGSADGLIHVWDTTRWERNFSSRSEFVHDMSDCGAIIALLMLPNSHSVVCVAENGKIDILRIDVEMSSMVASFASPRVIWNHRAQNGLGKLIDAKYLEMGRKPHMALLTKANKLLVIDIVGNTEQELTAFDQSLGRVQTLTIDRSFSWLIVTTSLGSIMLYDTRFRIVAKVWHIEDSASGAILASSILSLKGTEGSLEKHLLISRAGPARDGSLLEIYNLSKATKVCQYKRQMYLGTNGPSTHDMLLPSNTMKPSDRIKALTDRIKHKETMIIPNELQNDLHMNTSVHCVQLRTHQTPSPRTLAESFSSSGSLVSSSASPPLQNLVLIGCGDRQVRFLNLSEPDQSFTLAFEEAQESWLPWKMERRDLLTVVSEPKQSVQDRAGVGSRSRSTVNKSQALLRPHYAPVTATQIIEWPFLALISGDASGLIKVTTL